MMSIGIEIFNAKFSQVRLSFDIPIAKSFIHENSWRSNDCALLCSQEVPSIQASKMIQLTTLSTILTCTKCMFSDHKVKGAYKEELKSKTKNFTQLCPQQFDLCRPTCASNDSFQQYLELYCKVVFLTLQKAKRPNPSKTSNIYKRKNFYINTH